MGCVGSKLDELPVVALCRERCQLLDDAVRLRYALSEAHLQYIHALHAMAASMDRFLTAYSDASPSSPVLNLPPRRKGDPDPVGDSDPDLSPSALPTASPDHHPHTNSGSHIQFHSDTGSDVDDSEFSPLHDDDPKHHFSYMRSHPPAPAVSYEQRSGIYEKVKYFRPRSTPDPSLPLPHRRSHLQFHTAPDDLPQMLQSSQEPPPAVSYTKHPEQAPVFLPSYSSPDPAPTDSPDPSMQSGSSSHIHFNFPTHVRFNYMRSQPPPPAVSYEQHPGRYEKVQYYRPPYPHSSSPHHNPNPYYNSYPDYNAGTRGFYPTPYASTSSPPPKQEDRPASPPTPPSPPAASAWDFLNPFDAYEPVYATTYTPSRSSKEVREEEGIPDLEDDLSQHEVVKEVQGEQKLSNATRSSHSGSVHTAPEEQEIGSAEEAGELGSVADVVDKNVVEKNVVQNEERAEGDGNVAAFESRAARVIMNPVREVQEQFGRAADAAGVVAKMLEPGKLLYHRKSAIRASSKMLNVIAPARSLLHSDGGSLMLDFVDDVAMKSGNLSSTLDKLQMWEKKLYEEVKSEEKVRVVLERKCKRLKTLDDRGAEPSKVDAVRAVIRNLSTKIRVSIQVMDSISSKIHKLRDDELWPQLDELIHGLILMWKIMLECHRYQYEAISQCRSFDDVDGKLSDSHVEVTMQLERNLLGWTSSFCTWICTQKGYIKALNGWLLKCLPNEHEETLDGPAPFSPGRIGAPVIFVICNQWAQAIDRVSEVEIFEAVQLFSCSVLQMWERHNVIRRQKLLASKDVDRQMRVLEREEQTMQKEFELHNKKLMVVSEFTGASIPGQILYYARTGDLHACLKQLFEAIMKFCSECSSLYEGLIARREEYRSRS